MPSLAIPLISGLAGLFGGGTQQKQATSQTSSGTQTTAGSTSASTTPELSAEQQQLANTYGEGLINQYNQGTNLSGYEASGLQNIQSSNAAAAKATSNQIAARGLSFSPAGQTAATAENINAGNQTSSFLNSLPLLQKQLTQQNLQQLIGGFSALPTAVSSSGTSNQTQTSNTSTTGNGAISGNPTAGLFSGVGAGLAATMPSLASSLYGPNSTANSNVLNAPIPGLGGGGSGTEFGSPEEPPAGFSSFGSE
jgi:hypothetical protein